MKRKHFLALITVCLMIFGLAGCQGDFKTESSDTEQAAQTSAAENESDSSTAISSDTERETVLPPNMTMDDLLNIMQINGKAVELQLTVNELMEFDDKFSYEVDENSMDYGGKNAFFTDVKYDDKFMFTTIIYSEKEDRKKCLIFPYVLLFGIKTYANMQG